MSRFRIIQGGMGVGVSGWRLARAVSLLGQLGVVSGTGLAVVLARRLQDGDANGHLRRAMSRFPIPGVADRVRDRYFAPAGRGTGRAYALTPMPQQHLGSALTELTVLANFVEVFLAKEGHAGAVGINYLEKLQVSNLASLYGAMLAGVDYVLMGAGIPRLMPGALDALALGRPTELGLDVEGTAPATSHTCRFDPGAFCGAPPPRLHRPQFLAIISSATLALTLARKSNGRVDGFVAEGASAGGHNAPPRGVQHRNARGEPLYGPRDTIDLPRIRDLGLPFWLAGSYGGHDRLAEAIAAGASGIQVGTAFAFCEESAIAPVLKRRVLAQSRAGLTDVLTDPLASPTGFPFKVLQLEGTLSDAAVYSHRPRFCDLGYLRRPYARPDGSVGYRCPAEPVEDFLLKGGAAADTVGRKCICNALFATIALAQVQAGGHGEQALITAGDDVARLAEFAPPDSDTYTAADVIRHLLEPPAPVTAGPAMFSIPLGSDRGSLPQK